MSETQRQAQTGPENKMGVMPVGRLLTTMSLPMMASMLVQAFYNVVDSIFVSQISENALTAVSLAFPVQNLMISVAAGTGVGINALLSKALGERKPEEANSVARNGIFLCAASALIFMALGLLLSRFFFETQTDNAEIVGYGTQYLTICCGLSFGIFGQIVFERLLQSTGRTFYNMITQGLGAVINIILDPILIFGWFGLPAMGVAGAAVATVAGQLVGMMLGLWYNIKKNQEISIRMTGFRPNGGTIRRIYAIGVPSIIMTSISSVMIFGMNKILIAFSSTATAVFGVYFKLQSFVFMPIFGLNNGMIPIVAYNYGARKKKRMTQTIRYSIYFAMGLALAGLLVLQLFPRQLLALFNASDNMLDIGVVALRIISISYLFAGYCIITSTVFQALGRGMLSLLVSLIRQLIVLLPCAYLLSRMGSLDYVWWSFPIAELASVILCTAFFRRVYVQVIQPIPD